MSATIPISPPTEKIIVIASGKEGVGKTWIAIALARALAAAGERVLLFDGDLGRAEVHARLGLAAARDLGDVIAGTVPMSEAITRADGPRQFDVLAGRSGPRGLAALPARRIEALRSEIAALAERYDRVLIDTCAGIDISAYGLIPRAASCLAVTTAEMPSLTETRAFLKVMSVAMPQVRIGIVINMAGSEIEGRQTYATLRRSCGSLFETPPGLAGVVRQDPLACQPFRAPGPNAAERPRGKAADDIAALARALAPVPVGP